MSSYLVYTDTVGILEGFPLMVISVRMKSSLLRLKTKEKERKNKNKNKNKNKKRVQDWRKKLYPI